MIVAGVPCQRIFFAQRRCHHRWGQVIVIVVFGLDIVQCQITVVVIVVAADPRRHQSIDDRRRNHARLVLRTASGVPGAPFGRLFWSLVGLVVPLTEEEREVVAGTASARRDGGGSRRAIAVRHRGCRFGRLLVLPSNGGHVQGRPSPGELHGRRGCRRWSDHYQFSTAGRPAFGWRGCHWDGNDCGWRFVAATGGLTSGVGRRCRDVLGKREFRWGGGEHLESVR